MTEQEKPVETREYLEQTVKAWVDSNAAEFKENNQPIYREKIFDRCEKYIDAPDEYLKTMLDTLPDFMKWYLSVFETVFMAGAVGVASALIVIFLNNVVTSFQQWSSWLIPFAVAVFIFTIATLMPHRISHFIQHRFYVKQNLNEHSIEMYYIATIMKIRKEKTKQL